MEHFFTTGDGPVLNKLIELPAIRSDGTEIQVELSISPIYLGAETLFTAYLRDITERKRTERAVQESEGRLQLAVEIAQMGTFEIDLETDRVVVNEPGRTIYGWASTETTFSNVQTHFHPDDRDSVLHQVTGALQPGGLGTFDVEQRIYRTDGKLRWIRVRGRAFFSGEGDARRAVRCVGTYLDVTDRKEAEEAMKTADRRKDEFLALLAHELRNPLAPLRNGLQVLRLAADDKHTVSETRQMMDRQLSHMVRLIDDLLDVSRISRNKMELRLSRVLLSDAITSAVETARPAIDAARHNLVVSLPPEPLYLEADLTRLGQVFANLLTNSAKYTPPGGHINLTAERHADRLVISVSDNGIGIPEAALPNIFDMFSQVDRSIERSTGGLGIGLALVKGLVEMHGGEIRAFSKGPNQGSTFRVQLPFLVDLISEPSTVVADEPIPDSSAPLRVLVVDDNEDSAATMAMMLKLLGHEVVTAHDGVEAVETAERFRPNLILMDLGMPKLNGYDATRRIRELPWGGLVKVVALTGWGQEADQLRSRQAGCDAHLVKPVDVRELNGVIGSLFDSQL